MIKEAYVSFEVAKLLKEKGFDEKCQKVYLDNGKLMWFTNFMEGESFGDNADINTAINYDNSITSAYLCPTHQVAMAWLREEYGISIEISALKLYRWVYTIYRLFEKRVVEVWNDGPYISYDAATDYALKYCLENLNKFI